MTSRLEKACSYLITKAKPKPTGYCAVAVRSAVDFAFEKPIERKPSAKDYASSYEKIGFKKIFCYPEDPKEEYHPEKGDICIIQAAEGHPHGHICMLTSEGWISDFKQSDGGSKLPLAAMYGGNLRDKNPSFDILRYA